MDGQASSMHGGPVYRYAQKWGGVQRKTIANG
jgi:hypothetical protein